MPELPVLIVSNRGPISFRFDNSGVPEPSKSGGGLASALRPLLYEDTQWISVAMSTADRAAVDSGLVSKCSPGTHLVVVDDRTYGLAYNVVSNEHLWFAHHGLLDPTDQITEEWQEAWASFESLNTSVAEVVERSAPPGAVILIQDYHLCLMAPKIKATRPDLRLIHFTHTPFAGPDELNIPQEEARAIVEAMSAHDACGFHSRRWASSFMATCHRHGVRPPPTFVSPLAPDAGQLRSTAVGVECADQYEHLESVIGSRKLIARVDRIEPSKNIITGFAAYDRLLGQRPDLLGGVVFAAFVYPSRETIDRYRALKDDIVATVADINFRHGTPGWTPIILDVSDNLAGAVAAMRRYDVLLVNPLRDGLNLVALEGPLVNERSGQLVLSNQAGAHDILSADAYSIDPVDIAATADALGSALDLDTAPRRIRAARLRTSAGSRTPADWLADQLAHPHPHRSESVTPTSRSHSTQTPE